MKKLFFYLKLIAIVFLGIILVTEMTLRFTSQDKLKRWSVLEYRPDTLIGYRYKPDTTFLNSNIAYSNLCEINKFGFPGDGFEAKKKESTYRIVVVGTSDDTGLTSDGGQSYVKRLNKKFRNNGYNVEVINCSIDGRERIVRNMLLIRNELINYAPDLILLRNQFPLTDLLRYRETYKGNVIYTTKLSHISLTKKYIDEIYKDRNFLFKLYDFSYIFRYYCKIYLDYKGDRPKHWFVNFSEENFKYENLNRLRMYVRKEVKYEPVEKEFDLLLFDTDTIWDEKTVTWNNGPGKNKLITTFSSGDWPKVWINVDISEYLKEKVNNSESEISLLLFNNPSKMRRIMFASKEWRNGIAGGFSPILEITGKIKNKNREKSNTSLSRIILTSKNNAYMRGGIYSDSVYYLIDSVIQVKNGGDHSYSRKGLIKFDISNLKFVEKAILKLYVVRIEFGTDLPQNTRYFSVEESLDSLKSLQLFLNNMGIDFWLFETYTPRIEAFKNLYLKDKINYLPLKIARKPEYSFGKKDSHSTQIGHEAIANAFYKELVNRVLPDSVLLSAHPNNNF